MPKLAINPTVIQALLVVLFVVVSQILGARKRANAPKPTQAPRTMSPMEQLRESMKQASDQARSGQGDKFVAGEALQLNEQFQQPPKIQPESSFIPSMLLLALLACLCLMAYRYWAG